MRIKQQLISFILIYAFTASMAFAQNRKCCRNDDRLSGLSGSEIERERSKIAIAVIKPSEGEELTSA